MSFTRGTVGLLVALVIALVGVAYTRPPAPGTSAPRGGLVMADPVLAIDPAAGPGTLVPRLRGGAKYHIKALSAYPAPLGRATTRKLSAAFARLHYDLDSVFAGESRVPRLFLAHLPKDLVNVRDTRVRKAVFFQSLLPLVLQVNERILADRRRIWHLRAHRALGERLDAIDRLWLAMMSDRYGVPRGDFSALLQRVDAIPPSLALAQAAEESGWGTSRFAREGNAVFGQWTFSEDGGLTPRERDDGDTHKVRAFPSLLDSVKAYVRNLNTHRAYRDLRKTRASMRRKGLPLDGEVLADTLVHYSERGEAYVDTLHTIIEANGLRRLDDARLHDTTVVADSAI